MTAGKYNVFWAKDSDPKDRDRRIKDRDRRIDVPSACVQRIQSQRHGASFRSAAPLFVAYLKRQDRALCSKKDIFIASHSN